MKYRPYIQFRGKGDPDHHRLGFVIDWRNTEKFPTFDICYWWGWCMIYFARRKGK